MDTRTPRFRIITTEFSREGIKAVASGRPIFAYELVDTDTDKPMNTTIGLRYYVRIIGMQVARLLTWITQNMNYVTIPIHVTYDGIMSFSNAVELYCNKLDNSCIKVLYDKYNRSTDDRTRPVKVIYGVGHGIYIHALVSVIIEENDVTPILSGTVFIVVDTYGGFNERQVEFMRLIRKTPELVRPM